MKNVSEDIAGFDMFLKSDNYGYSVGTMGE